MKNCVLPSALILIALTGCATAPNSSPKATEPSSTAAQIANDSTTATTAPQASTANSSVPETTTPQNAEAAPPPIPNNITPEVTALIDRLITGGGKTLKHEIKGASSFAQAAQSLQPEASAPKFDQSSDPSAPPTKGLTADGTSTSLVEKDWTGIVLVPVNTSLSKAFTSSVQLLRVEAHPLNDGRVRIWARVQNISGETQALPAEIACSFRTTDQKSPTSPYFYELQVPGGAVRDVFFVSPDGELSSYTVLVRDVGMLNRK